MANQIMEIAERIKELREISGVSTAELAGKTSISEEQLRQFESGEVDIPVSFLIALSGLMGVELSALLTGEDPKLRAFTLTRAGKGQRVERDSNYEHKSLAANMQGKNAEPFLVSAQPSDNEEPRSYSSHEGQEFFYVLEGALRVVIDGKTLLLNEGDSLYFNSSYTHGLQAVGDKPAHFIAVMV